MRMRLGLALTSAIGICVVLAGALTWSRPGAAPAAPRASTQVSQARAHAPLAMATETAPAVMPDRPPEVGLRLLGVVAQSSRSDGGFALIAVGDNPPMVYRVGAVVIGNLVLRAVEQEGAVLATADGRDIRSLTLPVVGSTATGSALAAVSASRGAAAPGSGAEENEASPIIPPQPDMVAPKASEAVAPGAQPFPPRDGAVK